MNFRRPLQLVALVSALVVPGCDSTGAGSRPTDADDGGRHARLDGSADGSAVMGGSPRWAACGHGNDGKG